MNDFSPLAFSPEETSWTALFGANQHIKMWDDDDAGVMYDVITGSTHYLDPLAMELLRLLTSKALSSRELSAALDADSASTEEAGDLSDDLRLELVDSTIARLVECGLVAASRR